MAHCLLPGWHCTLDTAHCTLHTADCRLYTAHFKLHTANWTPHTSKCTLHNQTAHWKLHTAHCILYTAPDTLHTAFCGLCKGQFRIGNQFTLLLLVNMLGNITFYYKFYRISEDLLIKRFQLHLNLFIPLN